ncbi:MAG: hypothetical protein AAB449_02290 [Patescibacteria group bacterium]
MQYQRGFVGVGVLIAILVGLAVFGGGAYYIVQQQTPTQTASDNFDNLQQLPTNTTTSNPAPTQAQTAQTKTNASATFSVPGSFTITLGQTIKETGAATPVSITLKEMNFADGDVAVGAYCPMVELSNDVAPKQTVPICPGNPNYVPYLYQGLSFTITNSSKTSASFSVAATTKAPAATIDASSLWSSLLSPTITGTGANLDKVRILMGSGVSTVEADGNNGYVSIVNGRWSATFSAANFSSGKYPITVYHPSNQTVLATGTLVVTAASGAVNSTVQKINWNIEKANPNITDDNDYRKSEQAISVDVTFSDNSTKRYNLGTAYGCTGSTVQSTENGKTMLGKINCYFALTGVGFVAYSQSGQFLVERNDESAKDGSIKTTVLLKI